METLCVIFSDVCPQSHLYPNGRLDNIKGLETRFVSETRENVNAKSDSKREIIPSKSGSRATQRTTTNNQETGEVPNFVRQ